MKKILTLIITVLMGVMLTSCDRGSSVNQKKTLQIKKAKMQE